MKSDMRKNAEEAYAKASFKCLKVIWSIKGCDTDPVILAIRFRLDRLRDEVSQGADPIFAMSYCIQLREKIIELYHA